ncbi:hypothetical protein VHEMI07724 [[Torrubiella] hemipterigena]|uniref:Sas10 C-terminal domain-containing protein n=1 Tax=[Torrubiella] hemipterigena TaxID=1531966 RepID=A0A0A1TLW4_9HYPO|nr:hypothetical protein VHEMI07724 [[Torrubiella] hemipterigena]
MAKRRKGSGPAQAKGPKELDSKDARLGPITTYKDVADSEDEYFINQDTIMLEDEPKSKRQRQDEDFELSDEEILGYDDDDSDEADDVEEEDEDEMQTIKSKSKSKSKSDDVDEDEEGDQGWWGSSKKEYYNADNIETEADAQEEEKEAKKLQKKKLAKMAEEDFMFDGDEWLAADADEEEEQDTVTEVLKEIEITDDMGTEERNKLLAARYPELEHLATEFQELQPRLAELASEAKLAGEKSLETVKYWLLSCYIASITSYFAILTAPARDAGNVSKATDPAELRDHEVMSTLMNCREAWQKVKDLRSASQQIAAEMEESEDMDIDELAVKPSTKRNRTEEKAAALKKAKKLARDNEIEASVADLYNLPIGRTKSKKQVKAAPVDDDDNSDFGEEDALDARTAADKAARKKSLKFYTSQIVQKANKRAGAGRDAGGDTDLPYRERLRDRQARLMAEAQKRGQRDSKHGADLGDDSDDNDDTQANAIRGEEDDYYDMVANAAKGKREEKAARAAAYAAASKADRVVQVEEIGEDGKRKINYTIEKNKGLAPKRSKDARNPRVKKRKQYEAKQKKLRSMKPIWQGGEPKGGYKGELAGVNVGVVKSVKL